MLCAYTSVNHCCVGNGMHVSQLLKSQKQVMIPCGVNEKGVEGGREVRSRPGDPVKNVPTSRNVRRIFEYFANDNSCIIMQIGCLFPG